MVPELSLQDLDAVGAQVAPKAAPSSATSPEATAPVPSAPPPQAQSQGGVIPGTENVPAVVGETRTPQGDIQVPGSRTVKPELARDRSSLDQVASAVAHVESGNRQTDDSGKIKTSSKGALGVMQLMPDTARGLGVDATDETQNREGGTRLLGNLYDKYGNWDNALIAYNWGEGRTDKWLAAGGDPAKLPAETRAYVPAVLGRSGLSDTAATSVVAGKRKLTQDDLDDVGKAVQAGGVSTSADTLRTADWTRWIPNPITGVAAILPEPVNALNNGIRRGLVEAVAGPIQLGLEQVSPQMATQFTQLINERFENDTASREHPVIAGAGKIAGTTLGILSGAGMIEKGAVALSAQGLVPGFVGRLGVTTRAVASGAVAGATSYNTDPEHTSRVLEAVIGAGLGVLGAGIAKAVGAATTKLSNTQTYNDFVALLKSNVGSLTPSTSALREKFTDRFGKLWEENNTRYSLRNKSGEDLAPGFPRKEMGAPVADAVAGTRKAGVAPTATTRSVASQVDRELGGPESRAAEAAHNERVEAFKRESEQWQKDYASGIPSGVDAAALLRREIDAGRIPAPPLPPPAFEPPHVSPEQFSAAVQAINAAWSKTKDGATRRQLRDITTEMWGAAKQAADTAGLDVREFMRRAQDAGKFYRENIVPMQKFSGKRSPKDITPDAAVPFSGVSSAQFFDRAAKIIEGGDREAVKSLKELYGPGGQRGLMKVAAYQMLQDVEKNGPRAITDYVKAHEENLRELLGRNVFAELQGQAKIAQAVVEKPTVRSKLWSMINHPWLGSLFMYEGVMHGNALRVAQGAAIVMAPFVAQGAFKALSHLQNIPGMNYAFRSAAKMRPGSQELEKLIQQIENRAVRGAAVSARQTAPGVAQALHF